MSYRLKVGVCSMFLSCLARRWSSTVLLVHFVCVLYSCHFSRVVKVRNSRRMVAGMECDADNYLVPLGSECATVTKKVKCASMSPVGEIVGNNEVYRREMLGS